MYMSFFKRLIDFCLIFLFLPFLIPTYMVVALLVKIKLGSPILFKQSRPGLKGKVFILYKFRTMTNHNIKKDHVVDDNHRLSKFGNFLRSSSLDEIPSLWSVLKGDMTLVGPRPLLTDYLPFYSVKQARRHEVKPGITGWAQINGRNAISWEEKFELDLWYVDNCSLWLDIKILLKTIIKVISREGVSPRDQVIMPRFDDIMKKRNYKKNENSSNF